MKNSINQHKNINSHKRKAAVLIFLHTFYFLFAITLIASLLPYKITKKEILQYQSDFKYNYRVNINDNTFYDSSSLEYGKEYISSIVKSIDFDVNYILNTSSSMLVNVNSSITGKMVIYYANSSDSSELWNTNLDLATDDIEKYDKAQSFNYNRTFSINYEDLRNKALTFKKTYGLPINANVIITITNNVSGGTDSTLDSIGTKSMTITIPLLNQAFNISASIPTSSVKKVTINQEDSEKYKIVMNYIGAIGLGFCTILLTLYSTTQKRFETTTARFNKALDTYFAKYEQIIVRIDSMDNLKDLKEIKLREFDDLLDIEEEYRSPILYYEDDFKKEAYFMIVKDIYIYKFIVKCSSFKINYE